MLRKLHSALEPALHFPPAPPGLPAMHDPTPGSSGALPPSSSSAVRSLLVVYHSQTGATLQMAQALVDGAQDAEPGLGVRLLHASAAHAGDVLAAQAYVFATPENLGAISGLMKDFFDRTYYPALDQINGRACALLVCAGSDGHNAARQMQRIATGWRLKPVAEPLIVCTHAQTPEQILAPKQLDAPALQQCRDLGAALATGLAMGIY